MAYIYESKFRKTTIIYDKDSGLSHDIEKVFQSPLKRSSNGSSGRSSPDNNSFCCACLELVGGKLYTCSRCTSSFHSICHFPPLPINRGRVDRSKWLCHRCKTELKYDQNSTSTSFLIKDAQQREDAQNLCIIRFLLAQQKIDQPQLSDLSIALGAINAREFSLDNLKVDDCFYKLPFDEMFNKEDQNQRQKSCFYCKKFVEKRMLSCDFCPAAFCFDCMNPPIAALSNERFMCPLHVERFVDLNLVNSLRVTERMALWKEHTTLPEQQKLHDIFKDFCQKSASEKKLTMDEVKSSNGKSELIMRNGRKRTARMRNQQQTATFNVNKFVKEAYARAEKANNGDCEPSTSAENAKDRRRIEEKKAGLDTIESSAAARILLGMHKKHGVRHNNGEMSDIIFHPALLDPKLPVYAALHIISGADKIDLLEQQSYLIPIQAQFVTLGIFQNKHAIDLSQFSSCKALACKQALIFFDKSKLAFEMVSTNFFTDNFVKKDQKSTCKCTEASTSDDDDDQMIALKDQLDVSQGIVPSNHSAVLWNGAIIRIGCLRLFFVGLGTL